MRRVFVVFVFVTVVAAVLAMVTAVTVRSCPFPARRDDGGGGIVKFCVDDDDDVDDDHDDDDGARWRACARCVGACTIGTYGDASVGARAVVARTCAMSAIGAIGNLTARARALTRALACADGLFDVNADADAPTPELVKRYAEFATRRTADRGGVDAYACGRWRPLDDATWSRVGATYALNIERCVAACDARAACDGVSFCDDSVGAGCAYDALVAPYEPRTCLLFQRLTPPTTPPTTSGTENEGGSWCSAELWTPTSVRRDRSRGKAFIAYVDSANDDEEDNDETK